MLRATTPRISLVVELSPATGDGGVTALAPEPESAGTSSLDDGATRGTDPLLGAAAGRVCDGSPVLGLGGTDAFISVEVEPDESKARLFTDDGDGGTYEFISTLFE